MRGLIERVYKSKGTQEPECFDPEMVSVTSKSMLSGNFPVTTSCCVSENEDDEFAPIKNTKPSLEKRISTLSVDDTELEEDKDEVDAFVNRLVNIRKEDDNCFFSNSRQSLDIEECAKVFEEMIADREQLERILIARKYQLEDATLLFFEQVRFRARWKPKEISPSDVPNALPSGAWRLCGYTRDGYIVSNYKLRFWDPNAYGIREAGESQKEALDRAVNEYVRYVVYMLELMIKNMRPAPLPQKFCLIFDLKGFSPSLVFRKNVRAMIVKLIYVAQAQYPERLLKVMLVNSPMGFESAWRLIKPLLDEKTASKIGFCTDLDDLQKDIDSDVLSKEYGGTHEEYPMFCESCNEQ